MAENQKPVETQEAEVVESTVTQTYAFPISILEKEDNPQMDISLKMDINFFGNLYLLAEKFNSLKNLMADKSMSLSQKLNILGDVFKDAEVDNFAVITSTLIYAIANDQAEKGFITKMSEAENAEKMQSLMQQAIAEAEAKNPNIKPNETPSGIITK